MRGSLLGLMESVCLVELNQGGSTVLYCPEQESIRLPGVATLIVAPNSFLVA